MYINGRCLPGAAGDRVLDLVDELPQAVLPTHCRSAQCGRCAVEVVAGAEGLEAAHPAEQETLAVLRLGPAVRLGCQLVLAPCAVRVELRTAGDDSP